MGSSVDFPPSSPPPLSPSSCEIAVVSYGFLFLRDGRWVHVGVEATKHTVNARHRQRPPCGRARRRLGLVIKKVLRGNLWFCSKVTDSAVFWKGLQKNQRFIQQNAHKQPDWVFGCEQTYFSPPACRLHVPWISSSFLRSSASRSANKTGAGKFSK